MSSLRPRALPAFPLPALLLAALALSGCRFVTRPVIDSVEPRLAAPGDTLTISGRHFGKERGESFVTIGGIAPTMFSYLEWTDRLIRVRIPETGGGGLVYVHRNKKDIKSNPAFFANRLTLPQPVASGGSGEAPRAAAVEPLSGPVGSLVTLRGSGFGASREGGGVFFTWASSPPDALAAVSGGAQDEAETVEVSAAEEGYEYWGEREIRVRVPDGAVSGAVEVRNERGSSKTVFFEVTNRLGTKTFRDKRSYTFSYSVDIQFRAASAPNSLSLWMPKPAASSSQRNVKLLSRNIEPFVDDYRGVSLFQITNAAPATSAGVRVSFVADVYEVSIAVNPWAFRPGADSPIRALYTVPSPLVPSDDEAVKRQAAALAGGETNPYLKARRIYQWLITKAGIRQARGQGGALEGLAAKQLDSYQASLLFCALARAVSVPALPAAGVLVGRGRETAPHYWAEFWLDGFGWVPVDPALGAGAAPAFFPLRKDHAAFYFGSMDNQRVTFSRGDAALPRQDAASGRPAARDRAFALQSIWEEAAGGLEAYSSLWSDVAVTGVY
jgi:transglutaminase-like putative cysteine protease